MNRAKEVPLTHLTTGMLVAIVVGNLAAHYIENGDAPAFPDGCGQPVTGTGAVDTIFGTTDADAGDLADAFLVDIIDPEAFYATTSHAMDADAYVKWDTRLFLFRPDGSPLLANDDAPGATGGPSYIGAPGLWVGPIGPGVESLEAGRYVLVIAGADYRPVDADGEPLFAMAGMAGALVGPTASAGDFARWSTESDDVETGPYTIALHNIVFIAEVTEPCPADVNCDLNVDVDDLTRVILAWGGDDVSADVDGSGLVGVDDLLAVIMSWGACG